MRLADTASRRWPTTAALTLIALVTLAGTVKAQVSPPGPGSPWVIAPAFFPRGALINFVEGDPHRSMPIRVDLAFPKGYRIPPHFHAQAVRVQVRSGAIAVGTGDRLDPKRTRPLAAGDTTWIAEGEHHYLIATADETIISITCIGPLTFTYVAPADDPSAKKPFGR